MFIGGCSGSTGGGIKVVRIVHLLKQEINEMKYLIHPRGIFSIRISGTKVKKDILYVISGFVFLFLFMLLLIALVVVSGGNDILTTVGSILIWALWRLFLSESGSRD
jgi:trk system potassium uptake protein TrkH